MRHQSFGLISYNVILHSYGFFLKMFYCKLLIIMTYANFIPVTNYIILFRLLYLKNRSNPDKKEVNEINFDLYSSLGIFQRRAEVCIRM